MPTTNTSRPASGPFTPDPTEVARYLANFERVDGAVYAYAYGTLRAAIRLEGGGPHPNLNQLAQTAANIEAALTQWHTR